MALTKTPIELSSTPSIVDGGNATAITIDSSEKVGIGNSSPANKLAVNGAISIEGAAAAGISEGLLIDWSTNLARFLTYDSSSGSEIAFFTQPNGGSTTERVRIKEDGGFVLTPAAGGHAVFNEGSIDADFRVETNDSANMLFVNGGDNNVSINANNTDSVTNSATALAARTLIINGNEGEGSDNLSFFAMADGTGNYGMEVSNSAHTAQYDLLINPIMGGNVGIGTTSAGQTLSVNASGGANFFVSRTGQTGGLYIESDGTNGVIRNPASSPILLQTDGANTRASVTNDGITFNGDTAAANALDDYEEGTWTPVSKSDSTTIGTTVNFAKYVKIGSWVYVTAFVSRADATSLSGNFTLEGLPYQPASGSAQVNGAFWFDTTGTDTVTTIYFVAGQNYVQAKLVGSSGNYATADLFQQGRPFYMSGSYMVAF